MKIETAASLAQAAREAAEKKTLYVYGAYGGALYDENKQRALASYAYNRKAARVEKLRNATEETFGFDCSGLIKGLLWGWNGDKRSAMAARSMVVTVYRIKMQMAYLPAALIYPKIFPIYV